MMDKQKAIDILLELEAIFRNEGSDTNADALLCAVNAMRADGWVSVKERLPEEKDGDSNGDILVETTQCQHSTMSVTFANILIIQGRLNRWMPLPQPPEAK